MALRARPVARVTTKHHIQLHLPRRQASTLPPPSAAPSAKARRSQLIPLSVFTVLALSLLPLQRAHADAPPSVPAGEMQTSPRLETSSSLTSTPTSTLLRSHIVWTLTSLPYLIDFAPSLLHAFSHSPIPGLRSLTEAIVRRTFFAQFVPGESVEECIPEMRKLREVGVGAVLNYSAEVGIEAGSGGAEAARVDRLMEVERALDKLGEFESWVEERGGERGSSAFALKITGLIDDEVLRRASTTLHRLRPMANSNSPSSPSAALRVPYPGAPTSADRQVVAREAERANVQALMTLKGVVQGMGVLETDQGLIEGDLQELQALWIKLKGLGERAKRNGVKLMIDAEHTWYQPALDAYTLLLAEEFNRPPARSSSLLSHKSTASHEAWNGPLIFGTYQCYLTRQPELLQSMIQHAEQHGYALGIKQVRGAYFVQEREVWKKEGRVGPDPIWPDKQSTDKAYDSSIDILLSTMATQLASPKRDLALSVVFGTHNPASVDLVINGLQEYGLAQKAGTGKLRMKDDVKGKVFVAQLYGMKDDLMDKVVGSFEPSGMPVSLKYIAYGELSEVMPFLGRRAIENKSVMSGEGGAAAERRRISSELWQRWFGRS